MDRDHTFKPTLGSGACAVSRGEAWKTCRFLVLETTRMYANMLATGGVFMISYNICLANCTTTLANRLLTFGHELRRNDTPFDLLRQSNSYTEDCLNALHRYNERVTNLTKNAVDDIAMPVRVNSILAYGVIR